MASAPVSRQPGDLGGECGTGRASIQSKCTTNLTKQSLTLWSQSRSKLEAATFKRESTTIGSNPREARARIRQSLPTGLCACRTGKKRTKVLHRLGSCHAECSHMSERMPSRADYHVICRPCSRTEVEEDPERSSGTVPKSSSARSVARAEQRLTISIGVKGIKTNTASIQDLRGGEKTHVSPICHTRFVAFLSLVRDVHLCMPWPSSARAFLSASVPVSGGPRRVLFRHRFL